jgi:hypothetical protein
VPGTIFYGLFNGWYYYWETPSFRLTYLDEAVAVRAEATVFMPTIQ